MATIFLILALVVQAGFATCCMVTKSDQTTARSLMRISALAAFLVLVLLSVIEWSFRWYGLAALLLIWAALGAWTLSHGRAEKKAYRARRGVMRALGSMLLTFIALTPALIFPQHQAIASTGSYAVASVTHTYTDAQRIETYTHTGYHRKLTVQFWYPREAQGVYPLIVFSHGGFGVRSSNETLYRELASHGYVVASIDHTYQCFLTTDTDGQRTLMDQGYMHELQVEDARANRQQSYHFYQKWMTIRMGDINFVIDTLLAEAQKPDALGVYSRVDSTKIGVMGHSLGGSAALGMGRTREDIGAVIALEAPFLYDIQGVRNGEFEFTHEKYPVPVLNVYSDGTWSILGDRPQYAENYALLTDGDANTHNVYIGGVGHLSLTDFGLTSPFLTRVLNGQPSTGSMEYSLKTINKISLEFFDSYLKQEGAFLSDGNYQP